MSTSTLHIEKKKDLVPKLRFQEFDGEWKKNILKEICTFFSGGTPTSTDKKLYNGNIPFIGSGNIYDSEVKNYITEEALNGSSAKLVKVGDILYALYGANSGEVAISKMQGAINQAILCIRTKSDFNQFVYYLLLSNKDKIVSKYLQGGQGNLSADIIKKLKYSFPTLLEQQKIASFLSAVDEKIQQLSRKKELLEQYKKGLMQQLFSGELRFKDENGKDYPDWERGRFSKYIKLYRGSSPRPIIKYVTTSEDGVNWIKIGDTKQSKNYRISSVSEKITKKGSLKSRFVESGEIILANSMSFGKSYLLQIEGCIYDGWFVLREYEKAYDKEFLLQVLNSEFLQRQYFRLSTGGVVQNISSEIVYSTLLFRPVIKEQQKISFFLSSVDNKIESTKQQINQMQSFKKGLLQQLFV